MLHDATRIHFGSDNYAGVHPAVLDGIVEANSGHVPGYGDDPYTERLQQVARRHFGDEARAYPVFNGTGANVVALQSMLPRWGAVVTPASAHINNDENGAPERVGGMKLLPVDSPDGRLDPAAISPLRTDPDDVHAAQALAVSFSNTTELGTVHSPDQVRGIVAAANTAGMRVHCDGSRLANAAAAAGASLGELTEGVDVVSLGATKLGALAAEAIVVRNPEAVTGVPQLVKMGLQLASKQRFLAAQLLALYDGEVWLDNARAANAAAARLGDAIDRIPGCELLAPVEANAVFVRMPRELADRVRARGWKFYGWPPSGEADAVRLMCAWDTPLDAVDAFAAAVAAEARR